MKKLVLLFTVAIIFRLLLVPVARHGDMNNNTSWGRLLLERGSFNFYEGKEWPYSAPNQPPLYIYTFAVASLLNQLVSKLIYLLNTSFSVFPSSLVWFWENMGELYTAKLIGILSDIGIGLLIYKFLKDKFKGAVWISAIWLINPISFYNSAIWGGTDSVVNLLGLASIYLLLTRKKLMLSVALLVMSLLFKGSLTILLPVLLYIAIRQGHKISEWIKSTCISIIIVTIVCIPFHPSWDVLIWIFKLYTERFFPGEIGSLTANAFNFWYLIDPGKTLDSTLYFGVAARVWGYLIGISFYLLTVYKLMKNNNIKTSLIALTIIPLVTFLFFTRIHERYLYPFFPLATISLYYYRWLSVPYIVLTVINLLNLYHLFWAPGIPFLETWYTNMGFMNGLSFVSLVVFVYLLFRTQKSV